MIKVYTGLKGFAFIFFIVVGTVLLLSLFSWGIANIAALLFPLLVVIAYLMITVFVLGFLPATLFKDLRPSLGLTSMLMSHALGFATWLACFLLTLKVLGLLGLFFVVLFQLLIPVVFMGALLKGSWHISAHLLVWVSFIFAMKYYSQWVLSLGSGSQKKGNVIDVEAVEV